MLCPGLIHLNGASKRSLTGAACSHVIGRKVAGSDFMTAIDRTLS